MRTVYYDMTTVARWQGHPTGIARVVDKIARELMHISYLNIKFIIFKDNNWFYEYDFSSKEERNLIDFKRDDMLCSFGHNWDYPGYNKALRDVKLKDVQIAVLFYDIIPLLFPYTFGKGFSNVYRNWLIETLKIADISFAISESTKRDINSVCKEENINISEIQVIRLGDDIHKQEDNLKLVKDEVKSLTKFILSVGSVEYRKNHITLLNAYRLLVSEGKENLPTLIIVGREGFMNNDLVYQVETDVVLNDKVKILTDISDNDLAYLYVNCMFTVYPALYEGWGLPIAESLMYGKQCIASNTSSMVEIAPTLTRFVHPLDTKSWADNIYELTSNKAILKNENEKIVKNYKITSWQESAIKVSKSIVLSFSNSKSN